MLTRKVGDEILSAGDDGEIVRPLESFLTSMLREIHIEWMRESLDGIFPEVFRIAGVRELELAGTAVFISDQTLTAIHVRLQLSPECDRLTWIDLKLGERIDNKFRREPYGSVEAAAMMGRVASRVDSIDWFYHVGCGERQVQRADSR